MVKQTGEDADSNGKTNTASLSDRCARNCSLGSKVQKRFERPAKSIWGFPKVGDPNIVP